MNVVLGLLLEACHQNFHKDVKVGEKFFPTLYITKDYNIGNKKNNKMKEIEKTEAGKSFDN